MKSNTKLAVAFVGFLAGILLLNESFARGTSRLDRIAEMALGIPLFIVLLAYFYGQASRQIAENRINQSSLKPINLTGNQATKQTTAFTEILDWALIFFSLVFLPIFDLLDLPFFFWVLFFLSVFGAGLIISRDIRKRSSGI